MPCGMSGCKPCTSRPVRDWPALSPARIMGELFLRHSAAIPFLQGGLPLVDWPDLLDLRKRAGRPCRQVFLQQPKELIEVLGAGPLEHGCQLLIGVHDAKAAL